MKKILTKKIRKILQWRYKTVRYIIQKYRFQQKKKKIEIGEGLLLFKCFNNTTFGNTLGFRTSIAKQTVDIYFLFQKKNTNSYTYYRLYPAPINL